MAVKLDVSINWISNIQDLQKEVINVNNRISRITKSFNKDYFNLPTASKINAEVSALKKYDEVFSRVYSDLEKLNKKGALSYLIGTMFEKEGRQKVRLNPSQLESLATVKTEQELNRYQNKQKSLFQAITGKSADYEEKKEEALRNEKLIGKEISSALGEFDSLSAKIKNEGEKNFALRMKRFLENSRERFYMDLNKKLLKEEQERNKNSRTSNNLLRNLLKGRWGAVLGTSIAGAAIYGAYRLLRKGVGYGYTTSQEALDWQRTISGGAAGGNWFGKDIAAYQRAGIGAGALQGFKRGVQSYMGQVKLGMGNAAPLMYLGLSALDNPDEMEVQLEKALRRIGDKSVSLALAQQMGLDYKMWEAIYSGRLERERSFYSEEAIKQWAEVARNLNDLITSFKVFFFNNLAEPFARLTRFLAHPVESMTDKNTMLDYLSRGGFDTSNIPNLIMGLAGVKSGINVLVNVTGGATPKEVGSAVEKAMEAEGLSLPQTASTYN